jgi:Mor family transcriptional regulator
MSETVARTIIWRSPAGDAIACVEKNKVLQENLVEMRQICQDAFEDAVLMGCDEQQIRAVFIDLMNNLESAYPPQE